MRYGSKRRMRSVGFVTCLELGLVPDDRLTADELQSLGIHVVAVPWDDNDDVPRVDALILRSPWNYHLHPDAFMRWVECAAQHIPVYNDVPTIRWNMHKAYLDDLSAATVHVVPTAIVRRGEPRRTLTEIMQEKNWHEVVVKPAISASSYMTVIVGATPHPALRAGDLDARFLTDGEAHLEAILASRDALIQPFMPEIFTRGERSLIYFDGIYSHCIQKDAFNAGPGAGAAVDADEAEREIAEQALDACDEPPLYARVDLLRDAQGVEHLMELELLDPELYVRFDPSAPRRFAEAIARRLTA
jgi:glutathione synthase/RimK-type ligase-like ATP-grasp enzyme